MSHLAKEILHSRVWNNGISNVLPQMCWVIHGTKMSFQVERPWRTVFATEVKWMLACHPPIGLLDSYRGDNWVCVRSIILPPLCSQYLAILRDNKFPTSGAGKRRSVADKALAFQLTFSNWILQYYNHTS